MNEEQRVIAKGMLSIKAVSISLERPYVWSSGIKAPLYCDHRLIISNIVLRNIVVDAMRSIIENKSYGEIGAIAGVSTGGVPYASWLSDKLNLPLLYVRPSAKLHGKMRFIEGDLQLGQKVVIIEDVLTTGNSAIKSSSLVRKYGAEVAGVLSIFDYKFKELSENMHNAGLSYSSLYDFFDLISYARQENVLSSEVIHELERFIESPYSYYL